MTRNYEQIQQYLHSSGKLKSKRFREYNFYVKRIFSAKECLRRMVREGNALNDGKGLCQLGRQYGNLCLALT